MKRLLVFFMAALFFLMPYSLIAYDKKRPDKEIDVSKHELSFTYIRIRTVGIAEGLSIQDGKYRMKKTFFEQEGSGFVVKSGYVLTNAHVVHPDIIVINEDKVTTHVTKSLRMLERTILLYDYKDTPILANVYYIDRDLDVAILKYEDCGILEPIQYEVEYDYRFIERNDIVCTIVHSRSEDGGLNYELELKYGVILATEPMTPYMRGFEIAWFNPYDITIDLPILGGDSGSPLFAFRDGRPVVIGIVRAMYFDGIVNFSYAVTLPRIMVYIEADIN